MANCSTRTRDGDGRSAKPRRGWRSSDSVAWLLGGLRTWRNQLYVRSEVLNADARHTLYIFLFGLVLDLALWLRVAMRGRPYHPISAIMFAFFSAYIALRGLRAWRALREKGYSTGYFLSLRYALISPRVFAHLPRRDDFVASPSFRAREDETRQALAFGCDHFNKLR